ncbi:ABC transporter permease [Pseudomonas fluorescens]|uniref:ABC transporter permease n=1 Tax=Pseudomonas fluorescens TaxID=294 RepID=UPI000CA1F1F2|nr:ABC transporter permease [Pseudomonas fluorescens]AUM70540.1 ABC transporter permease [Pseudomonas fluorescens]
MDAVDEVLAWFGNPVNWLGADGILIRLTEHFYFVGLSFALAVSVAFPLGVLIANQKSAAQIAMAVFNVGRALPALGVIILAIMVVGYDSSTVILALTLTSIPPILTNTIVGIAQVDSALTNAAAAMGMQRCQTFLQLELPMAFPTIFAGFRTALVQLVATATIAAYAGFGGLGRFLIDGLGRNDSTQIIAGAVVVSTVAISCEWLSSRVEQIISRRLRPGENLKQLA